MNKPSTLWDSEKILVLQRNFYAADKPEGVTSTDIALVALLFSYKAVDHHVTHSIQTLSKSLGCDVKTIRASLKRLDEKLHWIHREGHVGGSDGLMLLVENIPTQEPMSHEVTQDAKTLSVWYQQRLIETKAKRKFHKRWLKEQFYNAQNILNKCDGDMETAKILIAYALKHPKFYKRASKDGMYKIHGMWKQIMAAYSEALQAQEKKIAAAENMKKLDAELDEVFACA
jgi:hypothetical protein